MGIDSEIPYMIQEKIIGINGQFCTSKEKRYIWKCLGNYAKKYQQVKRIENQEVEDKEFHKNWKSRLEYNIVELNKNDSLLKNNILTAREQYKSKKVLNRILDKEFKTGLVHGDLCPRNVIWSKGEVYLLDWGTAEINVVPHSEIGILLMSGEAKAAEFEIFMEGLEISQTEYDSMEEEIMILNYLHRLDKYRWAESFDSKNIMEYGKKLRASFEKIN
jgi:tRNA A-37 threonylcarbamoyl transferase component Bud32